MENNGNVSIGAVNGATTKLQVDGIISPDVDATYDLGTASLRFKDIYASNNVIQTSDARLKKNVQNSDLGLNFINQLRPVSYFWKDGDDQKLHYGLIAQETEAAIAKAKNVNGRTEDVSNVIVAHDDKTDRYGVRYTELISPIIKSIQELYNRMLGIENNVNREIASLKNENKNLKLKFEQTQKENADFKARLERLEKALQSK